MQEQRTLQNRPAEERPTAQAAGRLREYRLTRVILGSIVGLGLVVAGILGIQALINERSPSETQHLSPVSLVEHDPPLPTGWVDPYFSGRAAVIPVEQDPPLPDGWVDPYFNRMISIPVEEDPPLPEGWVDPYFQKTD